jgi:outer membrane lipoprotein-sorting protein
MMTAAAGCSGKNADRYTDSIYSLYKNLKSYGAKVSATLNHGEYVTDYKLEHSFKPEEGHIIKVLEPMTLAGLVTKVSRGCVEITYEGNIFTPQTLEGTGVTPIKLLPDMLEAWAGGIPGTSYFDKVDGREYIVQSFYSNIDGEEFLHRTWFDIEKLYPARDETFFNNKCVIVLEFESIEITPGTAQ